MVTSLLEGEKVKCVKYWPEITGSQTKANKMCILLESEKTYSSFLIHQLRLRNEKTKENRQVTHLQYTAWPDHGTPNPMELLVYYQYVTKAMEEKPEHKLLVHCSAGIGRTGTFIALDALHRQGVKKGKINIVEYVHTMREDRMNMIQNQSQYKFLYRVLYESFRTGSHLWPSLNRLESKKHELEKDLDELEKFIYPTYQKISSTIPVQKADLKEHCQKLTITIDRHGEDLHREIDLKKQFMKSDLEEMNSKYLRVLTNQEDEIQRTISEITRGGTGVPLSVVPGVRRGIATVSTPNQPMEDSRAQG